MLRIDVLVLTYSAPAKRVHNPCARSTFGLELSSSLPPLPLPLQLSYPNLLPSGSTMSAPTKKPWGRSPWATPEQTRFLEDNLSKLDERRKEQNLKEAYRTIAQDFFKEWPAEPSTEDRKNTDNESELQRLAVQRRSNVSFNLRFSYKQALTGIASKFKSGSKHAISKELTLLNPKIFST